MDIDISAWVNEIIKGSAGFEQWEAREGIIFHHSREEGIADFVIRSLANPSCEGSGEVLELIIIRRLNSPDPFSE